MKLLTFVTSSGPRLGLVDGITVLDVNAAIPDVPSDLRGALAVGVAMQVLTLEAGDVLAMGTPVGVGQARSPQRWMQSGDVYEVTIEGIGTLSNPILAEDD
jgi:hypothetical protein